MLNTWYLLGGFVRMVFTNDTSTWRIKDYQGKSSQAVHMLRYETVDNLLDVLSECGFSIGIVNDAEGRYDLPAGQFRVTNT